MPTALSSPFPQRMRSFVERLDRHRNVLLFVGGFLFDLLTIKRIDSWPDIALQLLYLGLLTVLLVWQVREQAGNWNPPAPLARLWPYNVEILHFLYGGLLSAYVVLYMKSSSGSRPLVFFSLLVVLLFVNEMPQLRRVGHRLRLGLYAFCVFSFLIYFVPVLVGAIGDGIFAVSLAIAAGWVWGVASLLAQAPEKRWRIFWPAATVLSAIAALYILRLVPPVPLSIQEQGIYHHVERRDGQFNARYEKPALTRFWRRDSRPFRARPGDQVFYFARIFAPTRFRHTVMIRWDVYNERTGRYMTSDRIPMMITGGRADGYRGFASKSNFTPGLWRVAAETADGRTIGSLKFRIKEDESTRERRWEQRIYR